MKTGEKTVFILGAGASKPYGYPTGNELRRQIYYDFPNDFMNDNSQWVTSEMRESFSTNIKEFTDAYEKAKGISIDLFLSINSGFQWIGKIAIVQRILEAEQKSIFNEDENDWYTYLFSKINSRNPSTDSYKEFGADKYSFVTFNYDRSLEYFLWSTFRNSYKLTKENELLKAFGTLRIWHIYGQIEYLPWQALVSTSSMPEKKRAFDYRPQSYNYSTLDYMSRNIRVIHDNSRLSSECVDQAKAEIISADKIIFLGFGFAQENLDVLGLPDILENVPKSKKIYSTCFHMTLNEREEKKMMFTKLFSDPFAGYDPNKQVIFAEPAWDCCKALREWNIL